MKLPSCPRVTPCSLLFIALAIALVVHLVSTSIPQIPPPAYFPADHVSPDAPSERVGAKQENPEIADVAGRTDVSPGKTEEKPQPVAAAQEEQEKAEKDDDAPDDVVKAIEKEHIKLFGAGDQNAKDDDAVDDVVKAIEKEDVKLSTSDDQNAKEEDNFGVMTRGRKRELPQKVLEEGTDENAASVEKPEEEENPNCLPMIFYDKPMKTGSTAVTSAIEVLLKLHNEASLVCRLMACGEYAVDLCANRQPKIHLIDHIFANVSTARCLKDMGYYSVTSIRDPTDRWNSAYLFNQGKKGAHYGISYNESYDTFMKNIPNCALLRYYDRGPGACDGDVYSPGFQKRLADILDRFDEIIDLYGEPITDLHKRLLPFLAKENVSKRSRKVSLGPIPKERLVYEQALYDALVKRRFELAKQPDPERVLCKKPRIP